MSVRFQPDLIRLHRWAGIVGLLLIAAWFLSGMVMIWVRMPALDPIDRIERLPPIPAQALRVSPAEALRFTGGTADRLRLGTAGGRPIWRLQDRGAWTAIWADVPERAEIGNGPEFDLLARRIAALNGCDPVSLEGLQEPDQWTLQLRALLPMTRLRCAGPGARDVYVSHPLVDVALETSRRSRALAYVGPVLHWLYFTPLRRHGELWLQVVLWSSIACTFVAISGLALGVWQWRLGRRAGRITPHRGTLGWHHLLGLGAGPLALVWLSSGVLSLEPWGWPGPSSPTLEQRRAFSGGSLRLEELSVDDLVAVLSSGSAPFAEGEVLQFDGRPLWLGSPVTPSVARPSERALFSPGAFLGVDQPFEQPVLGIGVAQRVPSRRELRAITRRALGVADSHPPVELIEERLDAYDEHYFDRQGSRPLPVVRYRIDESSSTEALLVDPRTGRPLRVENRRTRWQRWLYLRLHTWDIPGLLKQPTLRSLLLLAALGVGLAVALTPLPTLVRRWRRTRRRSL